MQDRVPLYPGRVTLTPVAGQENTFDMARADQPTQEGTPLNKATLLKDTTAAKFGKDASAVPDEQERIGGHLSGCRCVRWAELGKGYCAQRQRVRGAANCGCKQHPFFVPNQRYNRSHVNGRKNMDNIYDPNCIGWL